MRPLAILATSVLALLLLPPAASGQASFSGSYASSRYGWDWFTVSNQNDCGRSAPFIGREPVEPGRHPVLVYLPDTTNVHNNALATAVLDAAARAGFVAVSAKFADNQFHAAGMDANARCVFSGAPQSAVGQACARSTADCSMGVVAVGFSQGSGIAARARNHNPGIRAAYLIGSNEQRSTLAEGTARWTAATAPPLGTRALPNAALRIVNGEKDSPADRRDELNEVTGRSCPATATQCLAADGSGWLLVRHGEVTDGTADHCYPHHNADNGLCAYLPVDARWRDTVAPWTLQGNLQWLRSRTG